METHNESSNWLTERNLEPRWNLWVTGFVNLLVLAVTSVVLWWIFFSNSGVFKLYTPLLGFSMVIWLLLIMMWHVEFLITGRSANGFFLHQIH